MLYTPAMYVGIPIEQSSVVESLEERRALASRDVGLFWLMMTVALKYLLRRDVIAFYGFISALYWAIQDVKKRVVGEGWQYKRVSYPSAATLRDEIALVRQFCGEMLALMPEVVSLGGSVPEDPMSIIEVWLSMVESVEKEETAQ